VTATKALLFVALAAPHAMLLACVSRRVRDLMPPLLALAPVPALVAVLLAPAGTTLVSESESEWLYYIIDTLREGRANLLMRSCTEAM
jgi:hypothetical protein